MRLKYAMPRKSKVHPDNGQIFNLWLSVAPILDCDQGLKQQAFWTDLNLKGKIKCSLWNRWSL